MQLVDSHCHINFEPLSEDIDGLLSRATDNEVDYMLCVAVNLEDYPQVEALARTHENIFASVGVHPNYTECHDPSTEELLTLAADEIVVAIGETGLDYYRNEGDLDWQRNRFCNHIAAAKECGKPLIIHTRAAAEDTMDILESEDARECGGVMHCFAEDWNTARRALDIGFYISFSGIVTFKNAESLREVARKVPLDRMLVETDCPYLAPVPMRGKQNEPSFVRYTAEFLAKLRNVSADSLAQATTDSFFRLFSGADLKRRKIRQTH
jgi:TatD DNase family protein